MLAKCSSGCSRARDDARGAQGEARRVSRGRAAARSATETSPGGRAEAGLDAPVFEIAIPRIQFKTYGEYVGQNSISIIVSLGLGSWLSNKKENRFLPVSFLAWKHSLERRPESWEHCEGGRVPPAPQVRTVPTGEPRGQGNVPSP